MKQGYKKVTNKLMREIFQNRLTPGDKLPTERALAGQMGVDRTSLRIALKQLESMNVLEIRHGDGIYVKDYLKNAGVDFLRLLFLQQEAEEDEVIIDAYIIDEVMAFWVEFMPMMIRVALRRISPRDIKRCIDILNSELENIHDEHAVVESELLQQEVMAEITDNLLFVLLSNSTRPLRKKLVQLFVRQIDVQERKKHVEFKRALFRSRMVDNPESADMIAEGYKKALTEYHDIVRKSWNLSAQDEKLVKDFLASSGKT